MNDADRERIASLEVKIDKVLETHERILNVVDELKPQVLSLLERLEKNPMFKMFLGGK